MYFLGRNIQSPERQPDSLIELDEWKRESACLKRETPYLEEETTYSSEETTCFFFPTTQGAGA